MSKIVSHSGVVVKADGNKVCVKIESMSACAACHAKGMCTLSDKEDKIIDVEVDGNKTYNVGDNVVVCVAQKRGLQAVLLAYVVPAVLVVVALVMFLNVVAEPLAIIFSLLTLALYYCVLYVFRKQINAKFVAYIADI
ncbi:MAG: SoxR reducing system RseC family protein [Bacteroidales bacterium]|nr:SoxR reducing system RseC family protein [Bacteroidales bacterium]